MFHAELKIDKFESPKGSFDYERSDGMKEEEETLRLKKKDSPVQYKTEEKAEVDVNITPTRIRTGAITARNSHASTTKASIERYQNLAFNYNAICKETESGELRSLQKQLREATAKFEKEKAVLYQ
jgi:hypothetical protein